MDACIYTSIQTIKTILFTNLHTQHILHWQLFLEDYVVKFCYIQGESNSLADTLSCLPFNERHDHLSNLYDATGLKQNMQELKSFTSLANDDDLIDLFVHLLYQSIAQAQTGDAHLQQLRNHTPANFQQQLLALNTSIWCYTVDLPDSLLEQAIRWYHLALSHIGINRLTDTMSVIFYNPKLCPSVEAVIKTCPHCQKYKNVLCRHGETAPREAGLLLWSEVTMDMIGPWTIEVGDQTEKFSALTIQKM
jgi:Integrase zinc binding domain